MTQPLPPKPDVTPDGVPINPVMTPPPVELFQLVLTNDEACVLHQFFTVGTRALREDRATLTSAVVAHMHVAMKHPKDYESLVQKLNVLADWHNANAPDEAAA